jgi:hypothetical protein
MKAWSANSRELRQAWTPWVTFDALINVQAAGLEGFFPMAKIHSGESDFDPPRFKPEPDVYLLAAEVRPQVGKSGVTTR